MRNAALSRAIMLIAFHFIHTGNELGPYAVPSVVAVEIKVSVAYRTL